MGRRDVITFVMFFWLLGAFFGWALNNSIASLHPDDCGPTVEVDVPAPGGDR